MSSPDQKLFCSIASLDPINAVDALDCLVETSGIALSTLKGQLKHAKAAAKKAATEDTVSIEAAVEGIVFTPPDGYFLHSQDRNEWEGRWVADITRKLQERGLSGRKTASGDLSPVDHALVHIQDQLSVPYAGPQTAYPPGLHQHGKSQFLCTRGPDFIKPIKGDIGPFMEVLDNLCGVSQDHLHGPTQKLVILGWLQQWLRSLEDFRSHIPGQTLVPVGGANIGKNLFATTIGKLGGDRTIDATKTFSGRTIFNSPLLGATLVACHDVSFLKNPEDVGQFWANNKALVANQCHEIHTKYGACRTMPLAGIRTLVTANAGEEAVKILPPLLLESGMDDKTILIKAYPPPTPYPPQGSAESKAWFERLMNSLPAVAWYLKHEFVLPTALSSQRFGVVSFHHPDIRASIASNHPDAALGEAIDEWFSSLSAQTGQMFPTVTTTGTSATLEGTATHIYKILREFHGSTFEKTSTRTQHLGHQLKRLRGLPGWSERVTNPSPPAGTDQELKTWRITPYGVT